MFLFIHDKSCIIFINLKIDNGVKAKTYCYIGSLYIMLSQFPRNNFLSR